MLKWLFVVWLYSHAVFVVWRSILGAELFVAPLEAGFVLEVWLPSSNHICLY